MTSSQNQKELETAVLEAAKLLGECLKKHNHAIQSLHSAESQKGQLQKQLEDAEYELLQADIAHGEARRRMILAKRSIEDGSRSRRTHHENTEGTRRRLWIATMNEYEQPEDILRWAKCLSNNVAFQYKQREEHESLVQEQLNAEQALQAAARARKTALRKRGKIKAQIEDCDKTIAQARGVLQDSSNLFALERALVDAACEFDNGRDRQIAYSYCTLEDLHRFFSTNIESRL